VPAHHRAAATPEVAASSPAATRSCTASAAVRSIRPLRRRGEELARLRCFQRCRASATPFGRAAPFRWVHRVLADMRRWAPTTAPDRSLRVLDGGEAWRGGGRVPQRRQDGAGSRPAQPHHRDGCRSEATAKMVSASMLPISPTQEERNVMAAPENLLRRETSLLQHADNPVHWRPWGRRRWRRRRRGNRSC
jgi:hypothetical protein